jgi:hypothetical protein
MKITDDHLAGALADALLRVAEESRCYFAPEAFRLVTVEHTQTTYRDPPLLIPRGYGTHERYRHPNDPMRMTAWAVWLAESMRETIELRVKVAVDMTRERFGSGPWNESPAYALEYRCERRSDATPLRL